MAAPTQPIGDEALELLRELAGPDATFREHQLEAVARPRRAIARRVLCVQRTGWGKSAVYFVATSLLRARGAGPTLLVSPLLALMRNQIAAAERLGIRAHDGQLDEPRRLGRVRDAARRRDAVDLLLISPERLNNPQFRERMLPLFVAARRAAGGRRGALHLRLGPRLPARLPPDPRRARRAPAPTSPCSARPRPRTTASSPTSSEQLGSARDGAAPDATAARSAGEPAPGGRRPPAPGRPARLARDATAAAARLGDRLLPHEARHRARRRVAGRPAASTRVAYSGEVDDEERIAVEERLLRQRGQVRRRHARARHGLRQARPRLRRALPGAGRRPSPTTSRSAAPAAASTQAHAVLLRGAEDRAIQDFFIEHGVPAARARRARARALIGAARAPATMPRAAADVNLGRGRLEGMLKILDVEGAVRREGSGWARNRRAVALRRRALRAGHRAAPREQAAMRATAPTGAA